MRLTAKTENGPNITDLESWFLHAPPQGGAAHWVDYHSAKELARSWLRPAQPCMPQELGDLFMSLDETTGFTPEHAVAEMTIRFDPFRNPRQADLAVWGKNDNKAGVVATIEGKADEAFSKQIGKEYDAARDKQGSELPDRIERLCQGIMGRPLDPTIRPLRYQLFYALAATATLAAQKQASIGVLVIHEFVSETLNQNNLNRNSRDLLAFIHAIPGWQDQVVEQSRLLTPIRLPGSSSVPATVEVSIGKIQTQIPIGAEGRFIP